MLYTINNKRRLTMYKRYSTIYIKSINMQLITKTFLSIRVKRRDVVDYVTKIRKF